MLTLKRICFTAVQRRLSCPGNDNAAQTPHMSDRQYIRERAEPNTRQRSLWYRVGEVQGRRGWVLGGDRPRRMHLNFPGRSDTNAPPSS